MKLKMFLQSKNYIKIFLKKIKLKLTRKSKKSYKEWLSKFDNVSQKSQNIMQKEISRWNKKPLISVIMPVYKVKIDWLRMAIESVRNQIYPHWELCIAEDNSNDQSIISLLKEYTKKDSRIKVVFRESRGQISVASNSAVELAKGEWFALLDHDDLLHPTALFHIALEINSNINAKIIYSDEDKISENGKKRFSPYFKYDFNIDLFYAHNMISHLGVYKADLFKEIGGFREGFEGAQDYDLALRFLDKINPAQIIHIPLVLYHWRSHDDSTSKSLDNKNYAVTAGKRALNDHFQRNDIVAKSEFSTVGYRTHYSIPKPVPLVSIIIPFQNHVSILENCLQSIYAKTTYPNYEIILIDNNSYELETLSYMKRIKKKYKNLQIIHDQTQPFNYSKINNSAIKTAKGDFFCFLNNDTEVITGEWLYEMMGIAIQPKVGSVGACLWYYNNTLQHGGIVIGMGGIAGHKNLKAPKGTSQYFGLNKVIHSVSAVTGACMLTSKQIFTTFGGFDENNLAVAFNDVDFCLRISEAGYRSVWTPYAELYHHESHTRGLDNTPEKKLRFHKEIKYMAQRWKHIIRKDPNYNPNLSLESHYHELAWPPRLNPLSEICKRD
ncbi:glycosyltransferase family 2 protein [Candidatus Liberibacter sp.]|uniref:glycosyltransferase family 2 protein n=1 Tax=Candidatus Liberibacter sp. TaxID=34022 RepID=UPI0015F72D31|nr:glycosyltransferase family 2 protein [Candidatus Liberibacter sp.]MBA5723734.1 glycosyltransferase family 2 protein [Candidatus Liberibacter sp.]